MDETIDSMANTKTVSKREVVGCSCMRNHDGLFVMQLEDGLKLGKKYFEKLLNEENLLDNTLKLQQNIRSAEKITFEEVRKAMS